MKKILIFSLLGTRLLAQVPTNGLIGAWTFNGNANDITGNGNHGTVYGATLTTDRCGKANSAYNFNGSGNYLEMLLTGPTGTLSRSVSFWSRSSTQNLSPMVSFDYGSSTGSMDAFQMVYNYGCNGVGIDNSNESMNYGNACLMNGSWHHIVAVFDANLNPNIHGVLFYIDGVQQNSTNCFVTGTSTPMFTGTSNPITIGSQANGPGRFFNGSLDDFYLYDRPLNSQEVMQLYNVCQPAVAGNSVVCRNSSAVYSVSAVTGATLYTWTLPNGWTGTSTTNTISVLPGSTGGMLSVSASGSCGIVYSASSALVVSDVCTYINESDPLQEETVVYPNPANGDYKIKVAMPAICRIFDSTGKLVTLVQLHSGENPVTVIGQSPGIYFIHLSTDQHTKIIKLIKE